MQIAGTICKACGRNLVFSSEGKYCPRCEAVVHLTCDARETCGVCGQPYQAYEPPKPNLLSEAILPTALRAAKSGGPAFAIAVGIGFAILSVVIWLTIEYVLSRGH